MAELHVLRSCLSDTILPWEGDLSMDRNDPGNWTSGKIGKGELRGTLKGISAAAHPTLDIQNLTDDQIEAIYREKYWDVARCAELPAPVAYMHMDAAVQHGTRDNGTGCEELLQRALGVDDDGVIGSATLKAVATANPHALLAAYAGQRGRYYASLSIFPRYGRGWLRRLSDCTIKAARFDDKPSRTAATQVNLQWRVAGRYG